MKKSRVDELVDNLVSYAYEFENCRRRLNTAQARLVDALAQVVFEKRQQAQTMINYRYSRAKLVNLKTR
jgi:hypothetical protein